MENTIKDRVLVALIVCSLAIILLPATALASPGHGAGILPDDPGQEPSQPGEAKEEADMTEENMGADTTEAPDAIPATTETSNRNQESSATTGSDTKKEPSKEKPKTAASKPEPVEKVPHDSGSDRYAMNASDILTGTRSSNGTKKALRL